MRLNLSFALVCMVRDSTSRYVNETAVATNASNALSFRQHEIIAPLVDAVGDSLASLTKEQKDALDDVDDLQILYQQVRASSTKTLYKNAPLYLWLIPFDSAGCGESIQ